VGFLFPSRAHHTPTLGLSPCHVSPGAGLWSDLAFVSWEGYEDAFLSRLYLKAVFTGYRLLGGTFSFNASNMSHICTISNINLGMSIMSFSCDTHVITVSFKKPALSQYCPLMAGLLVPMFSADQLITWQCWAALCVCSWNSLSASTSPHVGCWWTVLEGPSLSFPWATASARPV
jgi:hypothetical protein